MLSGRWIPRLVLCVLCGMSAVSALSADWPQWGGNPAHNMLSAEKNLPDSFRPGVVDPDKETMDLGTAENVKWVAKMGSETHGSPVIAQGRVLIGSNHLAEHGDPSRTRHMAGGWLACLDEKTGRLIWELVAPKLPEKRAPHSDTGYGICSSATVDGDRVYVNTNNGDVLCLDLFGMANGNDGPFRDEGRYMAGAFNQPDDPPPSVPVKPTDADIVWRYDMLAELDTHPHDASSCSILVLGDYLYVCTGNGINRTEDKVLNPLAPSLIVLDKKTGRLLATDGELIGTRLYKGQWSSPTLCQAGGRTLIIYPGGDGLCYAFEPLPTPPPPGRSTLKKVWAVECNPPACLVRDGRKLLYKDKDGPSEIVGTPVCVGDRIYVTIGRDPNRGSGRGNVTCIDAVRGVRLWNCDQVGRSMSTVSVADGLLYVAETFGAVHCLDAATGGILWSHKIDGRVWGSTMLADGKLYVPTSKHLLVFAAEKEKKLLAAVRLDSSCLSTPTAANGTLYVATQEFLYALTRRQATGTAATATTAGGVSAPTASTASADPSGTLPGAWPQFRGPARDGQVPSLPASMPELRLAWREKVAGVCAAGIAAADDLLVLADHDARYDYCFCRRLDTGREVWRRTFANAREMDYGAGPRATPLVSQGKVYVLSAFGELRCLQLADGVTRWEKNFVQDLGAKKVPTWGWCGSPLIAAGKLIVNPGGKGGITALDPATGKVLWQGAAGLPNYASFLAGRFGAVDQVIGYDAKSLGGWDLASGRRLWTLEVESSGGYIVPTPIALGGDLLVADANNECQRFGFSAGGVVRETPIAKNEDFGPEICTPVVAGGLILGQCGKLMCLDAVSLKTLWADEEEASFHPDCHLIVAGDRALAMNNSGELIVFRFDRKGLKIVGKKKLCAKTLMHPTVAGNRLLVRDSHWLYCYELGR
jgi:outer membrane protein assembly factor BamB